jgi:hypothetical protein
MRMNIKHKTPVILSEAKDLVLRHVYEPPSGRKVLLARFFGLRPQNDVEGG